MSGIRAALLCCAMAIGAGPVSAQSQATGTLVSSVEANSTISVAVEPALSDGRLVIKVAAQNKGSTPIAFGPGNISLATPGGKAIPLASVDQLIADVRRAAGLPVQKARVAQTSARPASESLPDAKITLNSGTFDNVSMTVEGMHKKNDGPEISKAEARLRIAALEAAMLKDQSLESGGIAAGQIVTAPLVLGRNDDRTLHLRVRIAGDEHGFTIAAPAD